MNVFEASMFISLLVGAVTSSRIGIAGGLSSAIIAGICGAVAGMACCITLTIAPSLLFQIVVGRNISNRPNALEWTLGLLIVISSASAPIATYGVVVAGAFLLKSFLC